MRLNKYLAECGVDSRRACDKLIEEGRIKINGNVVTQMGTIVDEERDTVSFDNHNVEQRRSYYLMLHKPKGYLATVSDDKGRKTVMELIDIKAKLFPVGRLDFDTEGLLLITNDGDLAFKLTHPKFEVDKTYVAKIVGQLNATELNQLREGVEIDGKSTSSAKVQVIEYDGVNSRVEMIIHEGRNRQVKKMFEVVGKEVIFLKRTAIGDLRLGGLTRSTYRFLTPKEVNYLKTL